MRIGIGLVRCKYGEFGAIFWLDVVQCRAGGVKAASRFLDRKGADFVFVFGKKRGVRQNAFCIYSFRVGLDSALIFH